MKKRNFVAGLVALLVIIAGIWGVLSIHTHSSSLAVSKSGTATAFAQTSLYRTGALVIPTVKVSTSPAKCDSKDIPHDDAEPGMVAAIKPHLCSVPTFTEQDVRQYMETVSSFNSMRISQTSAKYILTRILFVTNQIANAANGLNADTGIRDPDRIVCYVEVYGDFRVDGGPSMPLTKATPIPRPAYHHGEIVFDGITGTTLVMGVAP